MLGRMYMRKEITLKQYVELAKAVRERYEKKVINH